MVLERPSYFFVLPFRISNMQIHSGTHFRNGSFYFGMYHFSSIHTFLLFYQFWYVPSRKACILFFFLIVFGMHTSSSTTYNFSFSSNLVCIFSKNVGSPQENYILFSLFFSFGMYAHLKPEYNFSLYSILVCMHSKNLHTGLHISIFWYVCTRKTYILFSSFT